MKISFKGISLTLLKVAALLLVAKMIGFQTPELRYDFGPREPVVIDSPEQLSVDRFGGSTFVSVRGRADLDKAAAFAKHGVAFNYFLLKEYGTTLVVRTPEKIDENWADIERHLGRLSPYRRMPFSRSIRAGFESLYGETIPDDALYLARDDVPRPNGWNIGAVVFAGLLWIVMAYFFFLYRPRRSENLTSSHQGQPEPA
jgi:hypothetical protein